MLTHKIELNKVFAFFLKENKITPNFKKESYGYRTYDSKWKIFENSLTITETQKSKRYNGYDYDEVLDVLTYKIEFLEKTLKIAYLNTVRY